MPFYTAPTAKSLKRVAKKADEAATKPKDTSAKIPSYDDLIEIGQGSRDLKTPKKSKDKDKDKDNNNNGKRPSNDEQTTRDENADENTKRFGFLKGLIQDDKGRVPVPVRKLLAKPSDEIDRIREQDGTDQRLKAQHLELQLFFSLSLQNRQGVPPPTASSCALKKSRGAGSNWNNTLSIWRARLIF